MGRGVEIGQRSEGKATELLLKKASFPSAPPEVDVLQIIAAPGYLPLAFNLAGAFIYLNTVSAAEYLRLFNPFKANVLDFSRGLINYEKIVLTTWTLSFEALRKRNLRAANLFQLCIFLNNEDIGEDYLQIAAEARDIPQPAAFM